MVPRVVLSLAGGCVDRCVDVWVCGWVGVGVGVFR